MLAKKRGKKGKRLHVASQQCFEILDVLFLVFFQFFPEASAFISIGRIFLIVVLYLLQALAFLNKLLHEVIYIVI
jgi:hypothetical protein